MQILPQSAISWQLLKKRFYSLKKIFFLRLKGLEMVLKKSSLIWKFFHWFGLNPPPLFFPDFPDWKKSSKFSLISLIARNPGYSVYKYALGSINTKRLFQFEMNIYLPVFDVHIKHTKVSLKPELVNGNRPEM